MHLVLFFFSLYLRTIMILVQFRPYSWIRFPQTQLAFAYKKLYCQLDAWYKQYKYVVSKMYYSL